MKVNIQKSIPASFSHYRVQKHAGIGLYIFTFAYHPYLVCILLGMPSPTSLKVLICTCVESLVSFLCKHDIIEIGLKQKGNVLHVVQPTKASLPPLYIWRFSCEKKNTRLQYQSVFQSSNLIGWVRVNLGCC